MKEQFFGTNFWKKFIIQRIKQNWSFINDEQTKWKKVECAQVYLKSWMRPGLFSIFHSAPSNKGLKGDPLFEVPSFQNLFVPKELSLWIKSQFSNTYISTTKLCKPLIFQILIVWSNRSHSLKYLRFTTMGR